MVGRVGSDVIINDEVYNFLVKENEQAATYEESKEKIKEAIFEKKLATAYSTWIQSKYTEYDIETSL